MKSLSAGNNLQAESLDYISSFCASGGPLVYDAFSEEMVVVAH
jgi:hypothetical protein